MTDKLSISVSPGIDNATNEPVALLTVSGTTYKLPAHVAFSLASDLTNAINMAGIQAKLKEWLITEHSFTLEQANQVLGAFASADRAKRNSNLTPLF